jgi:thioester reductase-like protein
VCDYTLLTGATGLLGEYLMRDLLLDGHRLAVLVRPSRKQTAIERVESIFQMWEKSLGQLLPRPVCLEGDVTQEGLGISDSQRDWVTANCQNMLHNAAVLTFHGSDPAGDPWRTNVEGTREVLRACRDMSIPNMHYVSTSYVCGSRPGLIMEHELDEGQAFRNDYENSKFMAESLVREADFFDQLTVYRPAVIAGDSQTGYTSTYHGLYMYLKLMSVLVRNEQPQADGRRHTPVKLGMSGNELRNIIPVDWTSKAICRLFGTAEAHGGTYHLAPEDPLTPREIIEAGYKFFNSYGVKFNGSEVASEMSGGNMDEAAHENMTMYASYETTDPRFDTTNLRQFMPDSPCPKIDEQMLHRFWQYGENDRWGKRPRPKTGAPLSIGDYLDRVSLDERAGGSNGSRKTGKADTEVLGLEVLGPGGGQWRMVFSGKRPVSVEPGLPLDGEQLMRLSAKDFHSLAEGEVRPAAVYVEQSFEGEFREGFAEIVADALFPSSRRSSTRTGKTSDRVPHNTKSNGNGHSDSRKSPNHTSIDG